MSHALALSASGEWVSFSVLGAVEVAAAATLVATAVRVYATAKCVRSDSLKLEGLKLCADGDGWSCENDGNIKPFGEKRPMFILMRNELRIYALLLLI